MFNPFDWYWCADDGRIYGSARQAIILADDDDHQAWLATGRIPTRWPSDAEGEQSDSALLEVVSNYGLVIASSLLDAAKQRRLTSLTAKCATAIVGGFQSSALGAVHTYPSLPTDQTNLMGSVVGSILPDLPEDWTTPFWTADVAGEWAFRLHTADQIQQAGRDGKAHVVECQTIREGLSAKVMAATSTEEIAAIVWPEGTRS